MQVTDEMRFAAARALSDSNGSKKPEAFLGIVDCVLDAALSVPVSGTDVQDIISYGRILLTNLDYICELTGEYPEDEDAALVREAREVFACGGSTAGEDHD